MLHACLSSPSRGEHQIAVQCRVSESGWGEGGRRRGARLTPRQIPELAPLLLGSGKSPEQGRSLGAQRTRRGCRAPERSDGGARAKACGDRGAEARATAAGKLTRLPARPAWGGGAGGAGEAGAGAVSPGAAQALLAPC